MTNPTKTRIIVTVNIQRSTLTRLAIRLHFTTESPGQRTFQQEILAKGITELVPTRTKMSAARFVPKRFVSGYRFRFRAGSSHRQRMHGILEDAPAMLITLELIKARASWSQKHNITRRRRIAGPPNRIFQSLGVIDDS